MSLCHVVTGSRRGPNRLARAYDKPLYEQKCSAIFEHVSESYPERDAGVDAALG